MFFYINTYRLKESFINMIMKRCFSDRQRTQGKNSISLKTMSLRCTSYFLLLWEYRYSKTWKKWSSPVFVSLLNTSKTTLSKIKGKHSTSKEFQTLAVKEKKETVAIGIFITSRNVDRINTESTEDHNSRSPTR